MPLRKLYACELHTPLGEIALGRFTDQVCESGRKTRARHTDLFGKRRHGPVSFGVAVYHSECSADLSIAQGRQPTPFRFWNRVNPGADGLNDEDVRQMRDDGFSTRSQSLASRAIKRSVLCSQLSSSSFQVSICNTLGSREISCRPAT